MPKRKPNRIRIEFRKSHQTRTRGDADLTRNYRDNAEDIDTVSQERLSGKGETTRHRTVVGETSASGTEDALGNVELSVNAEDTLQGLVLSVHRLECVVQTPDRQIFRCAIRRILKNMATDQRHVVVAGDRVSFRREGTEQGLILRIEPRGGTLSRTSRNRRHVIVDA